ncbi:Succinate-semialdehyde dehydrogenase, mitochondrial [Habropoda laboriosa]|uniref:Succinate-semialdehyde dehydrogenase, mitochondrial n=1 Tax=Habropoda laboriosa TaxID=597456 RepID=A0A0L7QSZ8_9HYME|nr:PREDICTED: succinate-semialdehyde dehydrogenase, mitochondrial [Habropoda laboriosa]KOC61778.1 Succinate-semialdehyde dehydrogenase, mitochondrial [Habropoda laboriosa]
MHILQKGISYNAPLLSRSLHLLKDLAYVNGEWTGAIKKETFPIYNPVDKSVINNVPDMDVQDTQLAIDAASKAFKTFSQTTAKERSDLLRNWYNLMVKHSEDLAQILTKENGKSIAESKAEIRYGNSFVEWFSEEARRINGEILQAPVSNRELLLWKQPVGVAALITPWNFPHAMITRKAAAALAAGCTCVIKPSEDTPLTALALADLAEKAGFPHGTVNVITTSLKNSPSVGKELCESVKVRALSFTGSTAVGKILYRQCASNIKRLGLELGGNAPFIVFDSANIDLAVSGAMASKFRNTGQTCVSANRFFVQAGKFDKFIEAFLSKIKDEIKMGDGSKAGVTHGPLIKESQLNMVNALVTDAVQKGAKVHCGGTPLPELGPLFYAPTLITGVTQDMKIYGQEIFGPVAVIHKFDTEDEAIKKSNDIPVGLAGYFYSEDISQIYRVAKKLEVGMVGVNEGLISTAEAAFGGVKESGIGREGSKHGVDDFLEIKYVCLGNLKQC